MAVAAVTAHLGERPQQQRLEIDLRTQLEDVRAVIVFIRIHIRLLSLVKGSASTRM